MDFYYNKNIDDEEISSRMEEVLKDYKSDYGDRNKTLKKMLR